MPSRNGSKTSWLTRGAVGPLAALSGVFGAILVAAACVGDDPAPSVGSGGNDGSLSPDALPSQNCPLECLPPAPAGWTGPSAVYDGPQQDKPAACPTPGVVATVINAPVVVLDGGTCTYPAATKTLFDPAFEKVNVACGLTQIAACPERADCISTPAPAFGRLCIHKQGEELCPSEDYPVRFVAYAGIRDERECAPCTGSPRGGNCGDASTYRFMTAGCQTNTGTDRAFGACIPFPTSDRSVDLSRYAPQDVECPAHQGGAVGGATSTDPVTFCCTR